MACAHEAKLPPIGRENTWMWNANLEPLYVVMILALFQHFAIDGLSGWMMIGSTSAVLIHLILMVLLWRRLWHRNQGNAQLDWFVFFDLGQRAAGVLPNFDKDGVDAEDLAMYLLTLPQHVRRSRLARAAFDLGRGMRICPTFDDVVPTFRQCARCPTMGCLALVTALCFWLSMKGAMHYVC